MSYSDLVRASELEERKTYTLYEIRRVYELILHVNSVYIRRLSYDEICYGPWTTNVAETRALQI